MTLEEVKEQFPVNPSVNQDYRYVEYAVARDYLDQLIKENVIDSLTSQLLETRTKIQTVLGE